LETVLHPLRVRRRFLWMADFRPLIPVSGPFANAHWTTIPGAVK